MMKRMLVQGVNDKTEEIVTYGTLILSEPKNTVRAEPADEPHLQWIMSFALSAGPGKPMIQPTDNPRWFDSLPLAFHGSRLWIKAMPVRSAAS